MNAYEYTAITTDKEKEYKAYYGPILRMRLALNSS